LLRITTIRDTCNLIYEKYETKHNHSCCTIASMMSGGHDFSFIFLHSLSTNFCQKGNIYDKSFWWTKASQFIIDKEINTSSFF